MAAFLPPPRRRDRNFRERRDMLGELSDRELKEKYRLSVEHIMFVHDLIEEETSPSTHRSHPLSALTKLLVTLQFLAKGEFYSEGGLVHGVSKSSVCKSIWQVVEAIDQNLHNINFPTDCQAIARLKREFHHIARIPNCLGAVDGTHIAIIAPRQDEALYVCRKGYHSINVQATVDTHMRFTDIVAKWPGSTHDSVIFNNCGLKEWLGNTNQGWLLGDSGYPLRPYLMTPKMNPQTRAEISFNLAHSRTRNVVERAFGLLKSRFRCLHKTGGVLQVTPQKAAKLFVVCAKLHNLCLDDGLQIDNNLPPEDNQDEHAGQQEDMNAIRLRDALILQF